MAQINYDRVALMIGRLMLEKEVLQSELDALHAATPISAANGHNAAEAQEAVGAREN